MRLRNISYAADLIDERNDLIITNPIDYKNKWKSLFNDKDIINLEIGCGKGKFIYEMAQKFPNEAFIAIEKFDSVILRALEKQIENKLDNLMLVRCDATNIGDFFGNNEIDSIFLNFSDPWPKTRHEKRRLTSRGFITNYENILKENGTLQIKTDNIYLFEYSIISINNYGMIIDELTTDLHSLDIPNIMTEFEEKFSQKGFSINRLVCRFRR